MSPFFELAIFITVLCSVHGRSIEVSFDRTAEDMDNSIEEMDLSASTLIELANVNVGQELDDPVVMYGDIAMNTGFQNADPCTARGCKWIKATDGKVYVPYVIASEYSTRERGVIEAGLQSFAASTCIRFTPKTRERDFVDIKSRSGCFSFVGRRGNGQVVSLARNGCVFQSVVQHELLHALGFNHEQTRSDRDQNVLILLENVMEGQEGNFRKIQTNNLGTPYDYGSVMHYDRFAFSKNRRPTIIPIPDNKVVIGRATQMSANDILRINRLYTCGSPCE